MSHLETHQILCPNQFAFRVKHSCESQLLLTINDFAYALNNKLQVDIGILYFSKAFDKVPHTRLMQKLEYYGKEASHFNGSNHFYQIDCNMW